MDGLIAVKLEVDYMRQAIVRAFDARQLELKELLEKELDAALSTVNFKAEVRRQVNIQLPRLIQEAITQAIRDALEDDKIKNALIRHAMEAVHTLLARSQQ